MFVFVYGTLKRHYSNNVCLRGATFVTTGVVRGYELFNSGFPVANKSSDTVITGEIWDIGDVSEKTGRSILWGLDGLEGYYEDDPDRSMYHRIEVEAFGDDGNKYNSGMYLGNPKFWRDFNGMKRCPFDENTRSYTWSR
jgi:gamma-glutamylcyclotransferase (GGCT)/AIG2-like uncharacterized protein YtfP